MTHRGLNPGILIGTAPGVHGAAPSPGFLPGFGIYRDLLGFIGIYRDLSGFITPSLLLLSFGRSVALSQKLESAPDLHIPGPRFRFPSLNASFSLIFFFLSLKTSQLHSHPPIPVYSQGSAPIFQRFYYPGGSEGPRTKVASVGASLGLRIWVFLGMLVPVPFPPGARGNLEFPECSPGIHGGNSGPISLGSRGDSGNSHPGVIPGDPDPKSWS